MTTKDTKKKKEAKKKYNIKLMNNFYISGQMYAKGAYLLSEKELEYFKDSPFKDKVQFL